MGSGSSKLAMAGKPPTVILLAGLQGSGKTTAAAKLALLLRKDGSSPALVAADLQRPAAVDAARAARPPDPGAGLYGVRPGRRPRRSGIEQAKAQGRDVVIVDTAGRLQIDEPLMEELAAVRKAAKPHNVLLVLDAMTGQEAVVGRRGVPGAGRVRRRRDDEARRRRARRRRPLGQGRHRQADQARLGRREARPARVLPPDRMASRILGMGDVLSLIEKAEDAIEEDEQEAMEARMRSGQFTFDDFLAAQKMLKRMGPLQGVLKLIPGLGNQLKDVDVDERQLARVEAIVLSMTAAGAADAAPDQRLAPPADRARQRRRRCSR